MDYITESFASSFSGQPGRSHNIPVPLKNRVILDNHFIDREVKTEGCSSACQRPPGKLTTKLVLKLNFPKSACAVSTLRSSCPLRQESNFKFVLLPGRLFGMVFGGTCHICQAAPGCSRQRVVVKKRRLKETKKLVSFTTVRHLWCACYL